MNLAARRSGAYNARARRWVALLSVLGITWMHGLTLGHGGLRSLSMPVSVHGNVGAPGMAGRTSDAASFATVGTVPRVRASAEPMDHDQCLAVKRTDKSAGAPTAVTAAVRRNGFQVCVDGALRPPDARPRAPNGLLGRLCISRT